MRNNSTLLDVVRSFLIDIVKDYVKNKTEKIIVDGSDIDVDEITIKTKDICPIVVLEKNDTQSLENKMLEGAKIGSYKYYLENSVEIEGGYFYNVTLKYVISHVKEYSFSL